MAQIEVLGEKPLSTNKPLRMKQMDLWDYPFYFCMSLLVAVVVVYGFSRTVGPRLIHPPSPRPGILYLHAVLFTGWLAFFIAQSALVRTRNVRLHRRLGWFGLALGVTIPIVGTATAIVMTRLRVREGVTDAAAFMIVPFFDVLVFSIVFGLAFYWRKTPEFHRRLMLMATCALTAAAFGRLLPHSWFYAGVDFLILLGVLRDLLVTKHVHPVYLYGLPLIMLGQVAAILTFVKNWPEWLKIAHALLG
ncbi:MAG TPA: hypothetical protein VFN26_12140 [Candidatus Acidoferrum sp.]|nr:hypothetical protein [Candidatus Acidoferrum sp.]